MRWGREGRGEVGIRSAMQLAHSAFLLDLIKIIVPSLLQSLPVLHKDLVLPMWDMCNVVKTAESLLENASDDMANA